MKFVEDQEILDPREFLIGQVSDILIERLRQSIGSAFETESGKELLAQLVKGEVDPDRAADLISGH